MTGNSLRPGLWKLILDSYERFSQCHWTAPRFASERMCLQTICRTQTQPESTCGA